MGNSRLGGRKTRDKLIEWYGEDFYQKIGKKGGKRKVKKGFSNNPQLAKKMAKKRWGK